MKIASTVIGEGVSFINPVLGFSISLLLDDAIKDDGLTNLSSGRIVAAFESSRSQSEENDIHLQSFIQNKSEEKIKQKMNRPKYEILSYVEIDVVDCKDENGRVQMKRQRFYEGKNVLFYDLTSEANEPGQPGHNPTTSYGVEIREINYEE